MEHARLQDLKKNEKIPTVTLYGLALERKALMFSVGTLGKHSGAAGEGDSRRTKKR